MVEGETGFYIILRMDLAKKLAEDPTRMTSLREECLMDRIVARSQQAEITLAPELEKLDVSVIYPAFVRLMSEQN